MKNTISLLLILLVTLPLFSQRVEFEDPDLTWSFKKPKNWQIIDNGYTAKVSPSMQDTSTIYLTITYFEAPSSGGSGDYQTSEFLTTLPVIAPTSHSNQKKNTREGLKILGKWVRWMPTTFSNDENLEIRLYSFYDSSLRWEIVTAAPKSEYSDYQMIFKRIIESLKINNHDIF